MPAAKLPKDYSQTWNVWNVECQFRTEDAADIDLPPLQGSFAADNCSFHTPSLAEVGSTLPSSLLLQRSERNSKSDLTFTPGKHLCYRSEGFGRKILAGLDRGWVLPIQYIEKLYQQLHAYAVAEIESFGKAKIEIDERRCSKRISSGGKIDPVEITVSVRISVQGVEAAKVKTALGPKYAADLKLPGQIYQPVDLENMVES